MAYPMILIYCHKIPLIAKWKKLAGAKRKHFFIGTSVVFASFTMPAEKKLLVPSRILGCAAKPRLLGPRLSL
jgi:hypothetical protein